MDFEPTKTEAFSLEHRSGTRFSSSAAEQLVAAQVVSCSLFTGCVCHCRWMCVSFCPWCPSPQYIWKRLLHASRDRSQPGCHCAAVKGWNACRSDPKRGNVFHKDASFLYFRCFWNPWHWERSAQHPEPPVGRNESQHRCKLGVALWNDAWLTRWIGPLEAASSKSELGCCCCSVSYFINLISMFQTDKSNHLVRSTYGWRRIPVKIPFQHGFSSTLAWLPSTKFSLAPKPGILL